MTRIWAAFILRSKAGLGHTCSCVRFPCYVRVPHETRLESKQCVLISDPINNLACMLVYRTSSRYADGASAQGLDSRIGPTQKLPDPRPW